MLMMRTRHPVENDNHTLESIKLVFRWCPTIVFLPRLPVGCHWSKAMFNPDSIISITALHSTPLHVVHKVTQKFDAGTYRLKCPTR